MSNTIYSPFFYIIEYLPEKLYYAGCRTSHKSDPNTFMKINGYQTSSKIIHDFIKKDGINSFCVRKIKLFNSPDDAAKYETRFLKKINAANNPKFLNLHNNNKLLVSNTTKWISIMISLYGVDHFSKTEEYKERSKQTCFRKYGVENYSQSEEFKERIKQYSLENYGVEHYTQTDEVKNKNKQTSIMKYGVEHYTQTDEYKERLKKINLEKFGVESHSQTEEYKEQMRQFALDKYGVAHHLKATEVIEKRKQTNLKKYGVTCTAQILEVKEKAKQTRLKKYGVESYSQTNEFKEKIKKTNLEKYSEDNYFKSNEFKLLEQQRKLRPVVIQIYKYKKVYKVKIPHKLYFKKDEVFLQNYLNSLIEKYGEIK